MPDYSKMSVNQRIKELVDLKYFSQSRLAELAGVKPGTLSGTLNNDSGEISSKYLSIIAKEFPNISGKWLLTGLGQIENTEQSPTPYKQPNQMTTIIEEDKQIIDFTGKGSKRLEEQDVPLYDFEAAAGLVQLFNNRQNILDYIHIPNMPRCDGAVYITGDSMYPLLKSGDIVMYKIIPDIKTGIVYGNMYLLSAIIGGEEHTLVKYLQKSPEGADFVRLGSQNQHHDPIDIPRADIKALAFVKASIRINSMS